MEPETHNRRAIAIFAHNEARNIVSCLESVKREIKAGDECYVLNNGSSDDTGALVKSFSKDNGFCRLVEIEIGDKANAWNVFCHDLGVKAETFVFLDGDCRLEPGSLDALDSCLRRNPQANVAAALPDERSSKRNRATMLKDGGLAGNLYAVPVRFMERIRQANVRFPAGLIGDDSLLGALAYWNLDPTGDWDMRRIAICADASFSYDRLSFFSMSDVRLYYRRKIRYSLRYYQTTLMKKPLKALGLAAIPQSIDDVYMQSLPLLKLNWRGLDTWFDYLALKRIRKRMAEYPGERVSRKSRQVEIT